MFSSQTFNEVSIYSCKKSSFLFNQVSIYFTFIDHESHMNNVLHKGSENLMIYFWRAKFHIVGLPMKNLRDVEIRKFAILKRRFDFTFFFFFFSFFEIAILK